MLVRVTNCVTDPFIWLCELVKSLWLERGKYDTFPEIKWLLLS